MVCAVVLVEEVVDPVFFSFEARIERTVWGRRGQQNIWSTSSCGVDEDMVGEVRLGCVV